MKNFLFPLIVASQVMTSAQAEIFLPRPKDETPSSDFSWASGRTVSLTDFESDREDGVDRRDLDRILFGSPRAQKDLSHYLQKKVDLIRWQLQYKEAAADFSETTPTHEEIKSRMKTPEFQKKWKTSSDAGRFAALEFFVQKALSLAPTAGTSYASAASDALTSIEAISMELAPEKTEAIAIAKNTVLMNLPRHSIPSGRSEAMNVVSTREDSSLSDPADNNFWRKPQWNIRDLHLPSYGSQMTERGPEFTDSSIPVKMTYKKSVYGGFSPKFRAKMMAPDKSGKKRDFKVKLSVPAQQASNLVNKFYLRKKGAQAEARSESVANQIIAAIGYAIQPTFFKNEIHLYFPEASSFDQVNAARLSLIQDLKAAKGFKKIVPSVWSENIDLVFPQSAVTKDSEGKHFLRTESVSLEESSSAETDLELGGWSKGGLGRSKLREHRAALILHALLHDSDSKESNTSIRVKKTKDSYRLYYVLSDMGFAFGGQHIKDMPNVYDWNLVDWNKTEYTKSGLKTLALTYQPYHPLELFQTISLSDARWIVRRLAQLSLAQLESSFLSAQYPVPVAKFLAAKVYYRIQDISEALGLAGSYVCGDAPGQKSCFSLPRRPVIDQKSFSVPGYESCFQNGSLIPCEAVSTDFTYR